MMDNMRAIFERIRGGKMLLNPKKCDFFQESIIFLGYQLDSRGLHPCKEKVEAILKMAPPSNLKGVRSFLGLSGFYRKFIRQYSTIALPLTKMTKKGSFFNWTNEAKLAWETIKQRLSEAPILVHPDMTKRFTIITDSSSYAVGAILAQADEDGKLHPVSYGSAVLSESQQKWPIWQKELYSLVHFCEKYRSFLLTEEFDVIVDNTALLHMDKLKSVKNNRIWRWLESLEQFRFKITYQPSKQNPSDALSRLPQTDDPLLSELPPNSEVSLKCNDKIAPTFCSNNAQLNNTKSKNRKLCLPMRKYAVLKRMIPV